MLFNEPKLLKSDPVAALAAQIGRFSALQRAEIAEIIAAGVRRIQFIPGFSALQRAEIAEIDAADRVHERLRFVSVLFNEPKLLKSAAAEGVNVFTSCFSALQRAEIAEITSLTQLIKTRPASFQCSSTSRNC